MEVRASTHVCGRPSIVMCKKEANQIVFDSSIDAMNDSALDENLKNIISVGKLIHENLQNADEFNEFYPRVGELQLEHLRAIVPNQLSCLLDSIFSKSRSETAQAKKELRKVGIAHAIMQCCRKEGYISPLLLAVGLFVHQVTQSRVLVDVLHTLGFSVGYSQVISFEKCAAVSASRISDCLRRRVTGSVLAIYSR